jgi:hypothetical protein
MIDMKQGTLLATFFFSRKPNFFVKQLQYRSHIFECFFDTVVLIFFRFYAKMTFLTLKSDLGPQKGAFKDPLKAGNRTTVSNFFFENVI